MEKEIKNYRASGLRFEVGNKAIGYYSENRIENPSLSDAMKSLFAVAAHFDFLYNGYDYQYLEDGVFKSLEDKKYDFKNLSLITWKDGRKLPTCKVICFPHHDGGYHIEIHAGHLISYINVDKYGKVWLISILKNHLRLLYNTIKYTTFQDVFEDDVLNFDDISVF